MSDGTVPLISVKINIWLYLGLMVADVDKWL